MSPVVVKTSTGTLKFWYPMLADLVHNANMSNFAFYCIDSPLQNASVLRPAVWAVMQFKVIVRHSWHRFRRSCTAYGASMLPGP